MGFDACEVFQILNGKSIHRGYKHHQSGIVQALHLLRCALEIFSSIRCSFTNIVNLKKLCALVVDENSSEFSVHDTLFINEFLERGGVGEITKGLQMFIVMKVCTEKVNQTVFDEILGSLSDRCSVVSAE